MRCYRIFLFIGLLLVSLSGCARNTVPLVYTPAGPEIIPQAGAASICVVAFTDARKETHLGQRSDKSSFLAASNVQDWATLSLAAELTRQGFIVTTAPTEAIALQGDSQYIVLGSIQDIWLTENSSTSYECRMRIGMTLKQRNHGIVMSNVFNSSMSRYVMPSSNAPRNLLAETMGDLVRPMALAIAQKVR